MGIRVRLARHRALVVWLVVLVPVPLAFLGAVLFEIAHWENVQPQPVWRPYVEWYLTLGASATAAAIIGWHETHSAWRTVALAAAGFAAFFVWLVVYLEINQWVTGVPIFPSYD